MPRRPSSLDASRSIATSLVAVHHQLSALEQHSIVRVPVWGLPVTVPIPATLVAYFVRSYLHDTARATIRGIATAALTAPAAARRSLNEQNGAISAFAAALPPARRRRTITVTILSCLMSIAGTLYLLDGDRVLAAYAPLLAILTAPANAFNQLSALPAPHLAGLMVTNLAYLAALPLAVAAALSSVGRHAASRLISNELDHITAALEALDVAPRKRWVRWQHAVALLWLGLAAPVVAVALIRGNAAICMKILTGFGYLGVVACSAHALIGARRAVASMPR